MDFCKKIAKYEKHELFSVSLGELRKYAEGKDYPLMSRMARIKCVMSFNGIIRELEPPEVAQCTNRCVRGEYGFFLYQYLQRHYLNNYAPFAREIGVAKKTLFSYCSGQKVPSLKIAKKIQGKTGIDLPKQRLFQQL